MNDDRAAPPEHHLTRLVERPLVVAAVLLVCVLYMAGMQWRVYDDPASPDQALNAVIGHGLVDGRQLYADVWDQKPPGVYVTYAASELVLGFGPLQFYVLNLAGWIISLIGLYKAGKLMAGRLAGLCAGLIWAFLVVQPEWFNQPNAEIFMNAGLVWSFYFALRLIAPPRLAARPCLRRSGRNRLHIQADRVRPRRFDRARLYRRVLAAAMPPLGGRAAHGRSRQRKRGNLGRVRRMVLEPRNSS